MSKTVAVTVRVHKTVPACCRAALVKFAVVDRYSGGGEPGDRISCACGNCLVYDYRGWRLKNAEQAQP